MRFNLVSYSESFVLEATIDSCVLFYSIIFLPIFVSLFCVPRVVLFPVFPRTPVSNQQYAARAITYRSYMSNRCLDLSANQLTGSENADVANARERHAPRAPINWTS